jgi:hypothetical protein
MGFLNNIQTTLNKLLIKKRKNEFRFINIEEAKEFVVLLDSDNPTNSQSIDFLKSQIPNRNFTFLQIVDDESDLIFDNIVPVNTTDFTYLGRVKKNVEFNFIKDRSFDVLFDLTNLNDRFHNNIISLINSKTKVCQFKPNNEQFNLMIKFGTTVTNLEFLEQALFYLKNINRKK